MHPTVVGVSGQQRDRVAAHGPTKRTSAAKRLAVVLLLHSWVHPWIDAMISSIVCCGPSLFKRGARPRSPPTWGINSEHLPSFSLDGKIVVVTGASRGIGRGLVDALAAAGATVALTARLSDEADTIAAEVVAAGGRASGHVIDVANVTEAVWDDMLDVNAKGLFFTAQAAGKMMLESDPLGAAGAGATGASGIGAAGALTADSEPVATVLVSSLLEP
jgi:hypothetical protein